MGNTVVLDHSVPQIGYIARSSTQGDELDLVNRYINTVVKQYSKLKGKKAVIFVEPQIDTGYPDIVIVEYNNSIIPKLDCSRKKITSTDLKILYYIHCKKRITLNDLSADLGFSYEEVRKSFHRLFKSKMIYLSKDGKVARKKALSKYCAIKRIIAIEAKLDKWNEAIIQAEHNIWFATETYILLNKEKCSPATLDSCRENGIGVILFNGSANTVLKSAKRNFPVSYASLQFNEWLFRYVCFTRWLFQQVFFYAVQWCSTNEYEL